MRRVYLDVCCLNRPFDVNGKTGYISKPRRCF